MKSNKTIKTIPENLPKVKDIFHPTFAEEYELALRIGKTRFGSPCPHEFVKDGHCCNCLRKVVS